MSTKVLIVSIIGAATIAAAAVGGYSALRSNAADMAATRSTSTPAVETSGAVVEPTAQTARPVLVERDIEPAAVPAVATPRAERPAVRQAPAASAPATRSAAGPEPQSVPSAGPVSLALPDATPVEMKDSRPELLTVNTIEPARPLFEEVTVKEDSVIGIRLDSAISTETARLEDNVTAHVARDVTVAGHTAILSGARLEGNVSVVERGGKFKDRARVGIQFHSLILADGTRIRIQTETIFREGESPTGAAASKVGASALVGSILGAVIGGKKGAAIGATTGAAAGGAAVVATTNNVLVIPAGTPLTLRMTAPVTLSVERDQNPS
jgi:hypothetical protein